MYQNCGGKRQSYRIYTQDSFGKQCILESSYELRTSTILNELNIKWLRPTFLYWIDDDGKRHRYYPDFFVPEYNIFIDPKNDYLIKRDSRKIELVQQQNNIVILVLSNSEINKETIEKKLHQCSFLNGGACRIRTDLISTLQV